jgi:hypothetical protein
MILFVSCLGGKWDGSYRRIRRLSQRTILLRIDLRSSSSFLQSENFRQWGEISRASRTSSSQHRATPYLKPNVLWNRSPRIPFLILCLVTLMAQLSHDKERQRQIPELIRDTLLDDGTLIRLNLQRMWRYRWKYGRDTALNYALCHAYSRSFPSLSLRELNM